MKNLNFISVRFISLILILIAIPLLTSCNKKLSREEAQKLIIQKYNFPRDNVRQYTMGFEETCKLTSITKDVSSFFPSKRNDLLALERTGLIKYNITLVSSTVTGETWWDRTAGGGGYNSPLDYFTGKDANRIHKFDIMATYKHNAILTDKGNKDFLGGNSFRVSKTEFIKITGIVKTDGLNMTEVKYITVETPTLFGLTVFNMQGNTNEATASFRKYDDGWRIE